MVDWKIKAGVTAAVLGAGVIALIMFQKQIRDATFTAGQTIGQSITSPIQGFLEPFQKLLQSFSNAANLTNIPPPMETPPIIIGQTPPYLPGEPNPAYGTTPGDDGKKNNGNTNNSNSYYPYYPGISPYEGIPKNTPGTTTETITQTATFTVDNKYKMPQITINKDTTTSYTKFLSNITKQVNDFGQQTIAAIQAAWKQLNENPIPGAILIPGFPVINVPFIPAFAEKPGKTNTANKVNDNTKTSYKMGATSYNPVITNVNWQNLSKFWDNTKISVPKSTGSTLPYGFSQPGQTKPSPIPPGNLYAGISNYEGIPKNKQMA